MFFEFIGDVFAVLSVPILLGAVWALCTRRGPQP